MTIKQRRRELGITQAELAQKVQRSQPTVSHWEIGRVSDISIHEFVQLATALDWSLDQLYEAWEKRTTTVDKARYQWTTFRYQAPRYPRAMTRGPHQPARDTRTPLPH